MYKTFARLAALTLLLSFTSCGSSTGSGSGSDGSGSDGSGSDGSDGNRSDQRDGGDGSVDGPRDLPSVGDDGGGDAPDMSIACDPATCPQPTNECQDAVCGSDGKCGLQGKADGVATTQSAGDCKRKVCSGGTLVDETDDTDLPVDSNDCTGDVCSAGVPSNPPLPQDQACGPSGARFCDGAGACAECTAPTQCAGSDKECKTRTCVAGVCGVSFAAQGAAVASQTMGDCKKNQCDGNGAVETVADDGDPENDGNSCSDNSCSNGNKVSTPTPINTTCGASLKCDGNGSCVGCTAASDCAVPTNPCLVATCTAGTCGTAAKSNGTSCNDGNACSQTDTCQNGSCTGSNPVVCGASDQCHAAGTCNPATGVCSNPTVADGVACSDGNACTQTDTCQAGACTGANLITCAASDQCHVAGSCNAVTGVCSNPNKADGSTCTDGNACTQSDTCQAGACTGANLITCAASDQCHVAGSCNTATGVCSNPNKADGSTCTDGNACTQTDTCQAGACTGANLITCAAVDQCHAAGSCNTTTGVCSNPNKADGSTCTDGDACTQTDTCQAGACTGANLVTCAASDQCHDAGTCDTATGVCSNPSKANGIACNDGNACTQSDTCQSGACTGASPVTCTALDQCHSAGTCDTATGMCSNPSKADGITCSDGNACTQTDTCQSGTCTGASPVICTALDQCHTAGTCSPATGVCSNPSKADGIGCNDGNACTQIDTCQSGACTGASPVTCTALDQCHTAGTCSPATGVCSNPSKADGIGCNDGNACTQIDTCQTGTCIGASPVTCGAIDACHGAGTCSPGTGMCSTPAMPQDTTCPGGVCDGAGQCVECLQASDCGVDTECAVHTCTANQCGVSNTPAGTVLVSQAAGDCLKLECDGAGSTMTAIDDTDLPDDGNQCTAETCVSGTVSTQVEPAGTTCSQNGGTACDGAGACGPQIASTSPADSSTPVASTTIQVTFTTAVDPATVTGQTSAGACSGSVQVSLDSFASCIAFSSASAAMSGGNTIVTFTPAPGLLVNRLYKIRATTAITSAAGTSLPAQFTTASGFTTTSPNLCDGSLVISQVYGGGGLAGATYKNDFIELHNRGTTTQSLAGMSLQYASSGGTNWAMTLLSGSIPSGGYFLIREASGGAVGAAVPAADLTATIDLASTSGKVALVASTTQISAGTGCPTGASIVDFVGYGTANCHEGTAATSPSASASLLRATSGCVDVNQNSTDFAVAAVAPRNSATATQVCSCMVENESNVALEADYCDVQFPLVLNNLPTGINMTVYGRIYEAGVTDAGGANASMRAQLGYGPATANPEYESTWSWTNAIYNAGFVDPSTDEYQATFAAPAPGDYLYAYRFSLDNGVSWTVCDKNVGDTGAGSDTGLSFDFADLPVLTVTP